MVGDDGRGRHGEVEVESKGKEGTEKILLEQTPRGATI